MSSLHVIILSTATAAALGGAAAGSAAVGAAQRAGDPFPQGAIMSQTTDDYLRGKTVRWSFSDGPFPGAVYEHVFHEDGSVTWLVVEGPAEGMSEREQEYAALKIAEDVHAVSYLAASGYTLTVALNFQDNRIVGFASNNEEWYPMRGTFEVVD